MEREVTQADALKRVDEVLHDQYGHLEDQIGNIRVRLEKGTIKRQGNEINLTPRQIHRREEEIRRLDNKLWRRWLQLALPHYMPGRYKS